MWASMLHTTENMLLPYLLNLLKISYDPCLRNRAISIMPNFFFFLCCDGQRHLRPQLLRHREHNLSPPQGPFTARRKMKVDFRTKRLKFLFEVNKNQNASTNFVPVVCVYGTTYVVPYTHTTGSKLRCQTPTKYTTNISEPLRISVKYSSILPDDGSHTIRNMLE